jgi:hypothetical protein
MGSTAQEIQMLQLSPLRMFSRFVKRISQSCVVDSGSLLFVDDMFYINRVVCVVVYR